MTTLGLYPLESRIHATEHDLAETRRAAAWHRLLPRRARDGRPARTQAATSLRGIAPA
jgi:hypothetical protein